MERCHTSPASSAAGSNSLVMMSDMREGGGEADTPLPAPPAAAVPAGVAGSAALAAVLPEPAPAGPAFSSLSRQMTRASCGSRRERTHREAAEATSPPSRKKVAARAKRRWLVST